MSRKRLDKELEFTEDELRAVKSILEHQWIRNEIYNEIRSVLRKIDKRLGEEK